VGEDKGLYRDDAGQTVVRYLVLLERSFPAQRLTTVPRLLRWHRHDPLIE